MPKSTRRSRDSGPVSVVPAFSPGPLIRISVILEALLAGLCARNPLPLHRIAEDSETPPWVRDRLLVAFSARAEDRRPMSRIEVRS